MRNEAAVASDFVQAIAGALDPSITKGLWESDTQKTKEVWLLTTRIHPKQERGLCGTVAMIAFRQFPGVNYRLRVVNPGRAEGTINPADFVPENATPVPLKALIGAPHP